MHHFLRNKDKLIIPGVDATLAGSFRVTADYYDTPYGLVMPPTQLSLVMIRFLRRYKNRDEATYEWAPASARMFMTYLLNNEGVLEIVTHDVLPGKEHPLRVLEVLPVPAPTGGWNYMSLHDCVKAAAVTDIVSKMTQRQAVEFIDTNVGERFQKPITIDLKKWTEERKAKKLDQVFLQNHSFQIKD